MITLTPEERDKFAKYLEEDAEGTLGLIEQMKKVPGMEAIIKLKTIEVLSQKTVIRMLRSTETL